MTLTTTPGRKSRARKAVTVSLSASSTSIPQRTATGYPDLPHYGLLDRCRTVIQMEAPTLSHDLSATWKIAEGRPHMRGVVELTLSIEGGKCERDYKLTDDDKELLSNVRFAFAALADKGRAGISDFYVPNKVKFNLERILFVSVVCRIPEDTLIETLITGRKNLLARRQKLTPLVQKVKMIEGKQRAKALSANEKRALAEYQKDLLTYVLILRADLQARDLPLSFQSDLNLYDEITEHPSLSAN